jgi:adenosylcobyric acid synthase
MAKTLMVLGTASEVGKSLIVTGLCRLFSRAGVRVAPFKAQNMSNNAYVCLDGGEIGWAQALQARACGLEPSVDMNPVLLKPTSDRGSQVIVQGKVWGNVSASSFDRTHLQQKVHESFLRLSQEYELIVLEGAGGAAEINLRDRDIVNFAMAKMADAPVILVGDIDRGGVFASLVGTLELLEPQERERVKGVIINKFRGDRPLLEPGLRFLEERTGRPVLGVLPYLRDLSLEAEDSVSLHTYRKRQRSFSPATVNVAVVCLPHIANFTDFLPLTRVGAVTLNYVDDPQEISNADVTILPGSKNTIAGLRWLKERGWQQVLQQMRDRGRWMIGVCGGYQMMGEEVADPLGMEGERATETGLGFLPVRTVLAAEKIVRRVQAQWRTGSRTEVLTGYEIHAGHTQVREGTPPRFLLCSMNGGEWRPDGAVSPEGRVWGTYLHGVFESGSFLQEWLAQVGARRNIPIQANWHEWPQERNLQLDQLADVLETHLAMAAIWTLIGTRKEAGCPS